LSTQGVELKAIADAIRAKEGSTEPIPAKTFAARILAVKTEDPNTRFALPLTVNAEAGAEVTAENGDASVSAVANEHGTAVLILKAPGIWTVTAALAGKEKSVSLEVTNGYTVKINLKSRLPEGFTEVEYIQSNGTQYVDTKIVPDQSTRVASDFQFISGSGTFYSVFGVEGRSGYNGFMLFGNRNTNNVQGIYGDQYFAYSDVSFTPNADHTVDFNQSTIRFDGSSLELMKQSFTCTGSMCVFGSKNFSGAVQYLCSMKLSYFRVWKSGVLVGDFVPCKRLDGAGGLYDLASNHFFGNAGSGIFETGPVVDE